MTDIFDNRKIRMIDSMPDGDALVNMWFRLIVLAGKVNDSGLIYISREIPYTPETLASYWNKPIATVKMALKTYESLGMIELVDNFLHLSSWEKYQNVEALENMREKGRIRAAKWRERQKLIPTIDNNVTRNVTLTSQVTPSNAIDIDKDIDIDKEYIEGNKKPKRKRFEPPTIDMIKAYANEKGYSGFNAERFFNYYESIGWKVGKNPMKSWKAAVSNWAARDKETTKSVTNTNKLHNFDERKEDLDALYAGGRFKHDSM